MRDKDVMDPIHSIGRTKTKQKKKRTKGEKW